MKKSFSLLEIIVTITIISIISLFAINKYFHSLESSNYLKIKSEVALINNALNQLYSNQVLLGNSSFYLNQLDNAQINISDESLFTGYNEYILLDYLILSTSSEEKKLGYWIKESQTKYKTYLTKEKSVVFIFDTSNGTFYCDETDNICKELSL